MKLCHVSLALRKKIGGELYRTYYNNKRIIEVGSTVVDDKIQFNFFLLCLVHMKTYILEN